jgi:hypothetical protein
MFDLSALDAELDGLGRAPENVTALARDFAGVTLSGSLSSQLEQVDAELSALSHGELQASAAPAREAREPSQEPSGVVSVGLSQQAEHFAPEPERLAELEPLSARAPEGALRLPESELAPESLAPEPTLESQTFEHKLGSSRGASLTESQEIVLPDPIAREELSTESGELRLSGSDPESGSFELPDSPTEPRIVHEDAAPAGASSSEELLPFDDVQDALEGSQPIAVATSNRPTASPITDLDRDPDAEFDALLSEATDPRGIPTVGASSAEIDTDDLLRGLEGGEFADEGSLDMLVDDAPHEADALTRSLYEDSSDSTDIVDRATLGALETAKNRTDTHPDDEGDDQDATLASLMTPDELDSGELEIIDDEPTLAPQTTPLKTAPAPAKPPPPRTPTARPGLSNKAPPPPPPSGKPDKRPSGGLLGRLFTKREGE